MNTCNEGIVGMRWIVQWLFPSGLLGSLSLAKIKKDRSMQRWSPCLPAAIKAIIIIKSSSRHKSLWIPPNAWNGYDSIGYRHFPFVALIEVSDQFNGSPFFWEPHLPSQAMNIYVAMDFFFFQNFVLWWTECSSFGVVTVTRHIMVVRHTQKCWFQAGIPLCIWFFLAKPILKVN